MQPMSDSQERRARYDDPKRITPWLGWVSGNILFGSIGEGMDREAVSANGDAQILR